MPATTQDVSPDARRFRALEKAQHARRARAALKRQIACGGRDVRDILLDPPKEAKTMAVGQLLRCQRHWGNVRTLRALRHAAVSEHRELWRLTERQVRVLITILD
jgi:hypothetical protein